MRGRRFARLSFILLLLLVFGPVQSWGAAAISVGFDIEAVERAVEEGDMETVRKILSENPDKAEEIASTIFRHNPKNCTDMVCEIVRAWQDGPEWADLAPEFAAALVHVALLQADNAAVVEIASCFSSGAEASGQEGAVDRIVVAMVEKAPGMAAEIAGAAALAAPEMTVSIARAAAEANPGAKVAIFETLAKQQPEDEDSIRLALAEVENNPGRREEFGMVDVVEVEDRDEDDYTR